MAEEKHASDEYDAVVCVVSGELCVKCIESLKYAAIHTLDWLLAESQVIKLNPNL